MLSSLLGDITTLHSTTLGSPLTTHVSTTNFTWVQYNIQLTDIPKAGFGLDIHQQNTTTLIINKVEDDSFIQDKVRIGDRILQMGSIEPKSLNDIMAAALELKSNGGGCLKIERDYRMD